MPHFFTEEIFHGFNRVADFLHMQNKCHLQADLCDKFRADTFFFIIVVDLSVFSSSASFSAVSRIFLTAALSKTFSTIK